MATQLQFSRHPYVGRSQESLDDGSDAASSAWEAAHRHVAFAVHDAVPSPQLYLQQGRFDRPSVIHDPSAHDTLRLSTWRKHEPSKGTEDLEGMRSAPVRTMRESQVGRSKAPIKKTRKANPIASRSAPMKPARKPGWDSDARSTSNLFDTTLKKSVLFQPRPGDRVREVKQEEQVIRGVAPPPPPPPLARRNGSSVSSKWNAQIATTSLPSQPKRKPKDYVKMNMEKITGQRYETLVRRSQPHASTRPRDSVFERLAAPVIHKSLLRFRSPSPTRTQQIHASESAHQLESSPSPVKLTISSPVISNFPRQEAQSSPPRGRSSPSRHTTSTRASPIRERATISPSPMRSLPSRASSPGFRLDRGRGRPEQASMTERVFDVLDRLGRGRIGVEQILDGLRLLQLPATHNQVADYVYLIHEGTADSIDYDEWAILVGTLDAASQSAGVSSRPPTTRSQSSLPPARDVSPPQSRSSMRSNPPRSLNQAPSPQKSVQYERPLTENPRGQHQQNVGRLAVSMPPSNRTRIAKHSDDLADLLLEDLLLDTVEELNRQERRQTVKAHHYLQAESLKSILQKIEQIEVTEARLIDSGFALGYVIDGNEKVAAGGRAWHAMEKVAANFVVQNQPQGKLAVPLGIIMSVSDGDLDRESDFEEREQAPIEQPMYDERSHSKLLDDRTSIEQRANLPAAFMACLSARFFQNVEKNRVRFLKHRQLVESSLESTGMDQASVIEMLADLLLDEIAQECAVELENSVEALTDTLTQTLL